MRKGRSAPAATLGVIAALALPNPALAAGFEWDYAVAGSVPDGLPCASITGAKICYQHDGDRWWVKDTSEDHASAVASWQNRRNGVLYREGGCRNSMGVGTWGVCNKDYYEDSGLYARVCVVDFSEGTQRCSADSFVFQDESYPA